MSARLKKSEFLKITNYPKKNHVLKVSAMSKISETPMISFFKDGISAMAFVSHGITITLHLSQQKNINYNTNVFISQRRNITEFYLLNTNYQEKQQIHFLKTIILLHAVIYLIKVQTAVNSTI